MVKVSVTSLWCVKGEYQHLDLFSSVFVVKEKSSKLTYLLKTNAAMWFNKMCKIKQLKLNYINIKINGQKPQDRRLQSMPSGSE